MSFPIDITIPNAPNDPADDQPLMKQNFVNIDGFLSVDHIDPGSSNNGKHLQTQLIAQAPTTFTLGFGNLYSNTVTNNAVNSSEIFFSPDATENKYQITRSITSQFTKFATNNAYGSPPATFTQVGGWTFLPGNILFQYGFYGKTGASGSSGTIQFPVDFTVEAFSVSIVANRGDTSSGSGVTVVSSITTTGFGFKASTSGNDGFYWTAIGI